MKAKEHWITVFVHGTYGPSLLLQPLSEILKKHKEEKLYKIAQQLLRHKILFRRQFIPTQGLNKVEKCFAKDAISSSIIETYQKVAQQTKSNENNSLYAFGWDGDLNLKKRQLESVKLYNALCREIEFYKKKSINPKIQLICFSHGGNICLNLAGIHRILTEQSQKIESSNRNEEKTLIELKKRIKESSDKNTKFLSNDTSKNLHIDKLVLFATPIQQETESFCLYPFFKKIYNFYSENDLVQISDIASTKGKSKREINTKTHKNKIPRITQIQITINHDLQMNTEKKTLAFYKDYLTNNIKANLNSILRGGMPFPKNPYNPGHLDFWGVCLNKAKTFLEPLPLVVFTPIFLSITSKSKFINHLDMNITTDGKKNILFVVSPNNKQDVKKTFSIPIKTITDLKNPLIKALEPQWHRFLSRTKKDLPTNLFDFLKQSKILIYLSIPLITLRVLNYNSITTLFLKLYYKNK